MRELLGSAEGAEMPAAAVAGDEQPSFRRRQAGRHGKQLSAQRYRKGGDCLAVFPITTDLFAVCSYTHGGFPPPSLTTAL